MAWRIRSLALTCLIVVNVWRGAPYAMVLLLAGLQGISQDLYEAASIDGAGRVRSFLSITLPLMKTPLMVLIVLTTIADFNVVVAMLVLTGGGPGNGHRVDEPADVLRGVRQFRAWGRPRPSR